MLCEISGIVMRHITFIQLTINIHFIRVAMAEWLAYWVCKANGRGFETRVFFFPLDNLKKCSRSRKALFVFVEDKNSSS